MNFWTRKLAQEALQDEAMLGGEIDVVSPEEDVEAALLEVENDTQEIENHDLVAGYEDEDAVETEERLEALEEETGDEEDISEDRVELIAAAQESIRKRHGFPSRMSIARECLSSSKPRRVVAREGLWEDIKAFFRKIKDWFIEKFNMLKDRWLKFTNAGKTIQKKCKKLDAVTAKLGQKDKDTISGGFIESLTIGGKFDPRKAGEDFVKASDTLISDMIETCGIIRSAADAVGSKEKVGKLFDDIRKKAEEAKTTNGGDKNYCGNYVLAVDKEQNVTFEKSEKLEVPSDVNTPAPNEIRSMITLYNKVGVRLEKSILDWRKRERANDEVVKSLKKADDIFDKIQADDKSDRTAFEECRKLVTMARGTLNSLDRIFAHCTKHVTKGLNGYIVASIGAYKKAKV